MSNNTVVNVIDEFVADVMGTFPEYSAHILSWWGDTKNIDKIITHCTLPLSPPEVIYCIGTNNDIIFSDEKTNEEYTKIFKNTNISTEFLPNIDFKDLWKQNLSDNTRNAIWSHLKLLTKCILNLTEENMMETVVKFQMKLMMPADGCDPTSESFMENAKDMFSSFCEEAGVDVDAESSETGTSSRFKDLFGGNEEQFKTDIEDVLSSSGKLGIFAAESMEQFMEDIKQFGDIDPQELMKDPKKIMGIVKKIEDQFSEKIKSGELVHSEVLTDASNMMDKLKQIKSLEKYMDIIMSLLHKFGLGPKPHKKHAPPESDSVVLNRNIKNAQMKERILRKRELAKKNNKPIEECTDLAPKYSEDEILDIFADEQPLSSVVGLLKPKKNKKKKHR